MMPLTRPFTTQDRRICVIFSSSTLLPMFHRRPKSADDENYCLTAEEFLARAMAAVPHNLRPQSPYYATLSEGLRRRARAGGGVQRGRARAELADAAEADGGVRGRRAR
eukprot:6590760-Pyramimonas_sp.AAC.1